MIKPIGVQCWENWESRRSKRIEGLSIVVIFFQHGNECKERVLARSGKKTSRGEICLSLCVQDPCFKDFGIEICKTPYHGKLHIPFHKENCK